MERPYDILKGASLLSSPKDTKYRAVIIDLDGTLCDDKHRHVFIQEKQWHKYHSYCTRDQLYKPVYNAIQTHKDTNLVIILTGRPSSYAKQTKEWLSYHKVHHDCLVMTRPGVHIGSQLVKKQFYEDHKHKLLVQHVYEDLPKVCDMWRALSLPLTQIVQYPSTEE